MYTTANFKHENGNENLWLDYDVHNQCICDFMNDVYFKRSPQRPIHKGHIRCPKGTVPFGRGLARTLAMVSTQSILVPSLECILESNGVPRDADTTTMPPLYDRFIWTESLTMELLRIYDQSQSHLYPGILTGWKDCGITGTGGAIKGYYTSSPSVSPSNDLFVNGRNTKTTRNEDPSARGAGGAVEPTSDQPTPDSDPSTPNEHHRVKKHMLTEGRKETMIQSRPGTRRKSARSSQCSENEDV